MLELLLATDKGDLEKLPPTALEVDPRPCVSVVLAAGGYPEAFRRGDEIFGVEEAQRQPDVMVFHAGTARRDKKLITNGGRVMNVVAFGATYAEAASRAYAASDLIRFEGRHARRDIAQRAIQVPARKR